MIHYHNVTAEKHSKWWLIWDSNLGIYIRLIWSWNSNTLATWCEELTHLKRPWCWKRLRAGGEGDDRGWDGWMASPIQWTWVWVNSRSWWWTERPGVLQSMGLQRIRHDWATELKTQKPHIIFTVLHFLSFAQLRKRTSGGNFNFWNSSE